jgi:hypothetical protein
MLINAYGLFWRADEVNWRGKKRGPKFRLLGRIGATKPGLRLADFRTQSGLYILYGDYGPYYVGLTQEARLGSRLAAHILRDQHKGKWDRFSWFGFRKVLRKAEADGMCHLMTLALGPRSNPRREIADMEALLIKALGLQSNLRQEDFKEADQWTQVKLLETDKYLHKVRPRP